jgi:hypothetical protein
MRTNFEAINQVYKVVKSMSLPAFKMMKAGSHDEYVVVNSMPVAGDTLKRCFVNVNIHVKDIDYPDADSLPNTKRLEELSLLYASALEKIEDSHICTYYVSQGIEREASLNEHFVNIRLMCNLIEN